MQVTSWLYCPSVLQVLMVVCHVFLYDFKHLALVWLFGMLLIVYLTLRWAPLVQGTLSMCAVSAQHFAPMCVKNHRGRSSRAGKLCLVLPVLLHAAHRVPGAALGAAGARCAWRVQHLHLAHTFEKRCATRVGSGGW